MSDFIDKENFFGDDECVEILYEYSHLIFLLKQLIEISEQAVANNSTVNRWSHEGICFVFARSIISYAKMAYDNMLLGHFDASKMLIRVIVENNVCLDIIQKSQDKELWKYYMVHSLRSTIVGLRKEVSVDNHKLFEEIYREYDIEKEFTEKRGGKKAYIDINYGWTYKINSKFTFEGLCALVNKRDYDDFRMMSMYSHGTSIYIKTIDSVFIDGFMNVISGIYAGLCRLIAMYCRDYVDNDFYLIGDEMATIINHYLYENE